MQSNHYEIQLSVNLRSLLKEKEMAIVSLSRKTKIPLQILHGWLSGVEPRSLKQIKIVAEYFDQSIDDLCFSSSKKKKILKVLNDKRVRNEIN
ncbi:MAG: helix-turn-helix domain-containing protein [Bacteriovorax sp.]|nr:helix-turn-helix domain-containing protein [Bacteriovorax sp.]